MMHCSEQEKWEVNIQLQEIDQHFYLEQNTWNFYKDYKYDMEEYISKGLYFILKLNQMVFQW